MFGKARNEASTPVSSHLTQNRMWTVKRRRKGQCARGFLRSQGTSASGMESLREVGFDFSRQVGAEES